MMRRCYLKTEKDYIRYGAKGIFVDKSWWCFQNYVKDCMSIEGYNEEDIKNKKLELDKDIKIKNNKIYSKETCLWVKASENNRHHSINQFENSAVIDILDNKILIVDNLKSFCDKNEEFNVNGVRCSRKNKTLYKNRWYILYESDYNENKELYEKYLSQQKEETTTND